MSYIQSALQCIQSQYSTIYTNSAFYRGAIMVMIVVPMQSVPITTKVVSSNAAHG
jgi:hypothetical protein